MYENLRLSKLIFTWVSEELKLIVNFSNDYSKVGMENQRISDKFFGIAVYEKISDFQRRNPIL